MSKGSKGKVSNKIQQGFTIIEVIIVLVIAAIIMLAVFLVVPQLQRTQRNNRAQTVARQAFTAAEQYAANNNGAYPTTVAQLEASTGTLKNGANAQYVIKADAAPTTLTDLSMSTGGATPVAVVCSNSSDGTSAWTGGAKFKIVIAQETSTATLAFFCISN